jgi:hypothetical protein
MRVVRRSLDEYWDKSNDIALVTRLFLILLRPGTKHIEVQLGGEEQIDLPFLIRQRSFSVIGIEGVVLRIMEAAK